MPFDWHQPRMTDATRVVRVVGLSVIFLKMYHYDVQTLLLMSLWLRVFHMKLFILLTSFQIPLWHLCPLTVPFHVTWRPLYPFGSVCDFISLCNVICVPVLFDMSRKSSLDFGWTRSKNNNDDDDGDDKDMQKATSIYNGAKQLLWKWKQISEKLHSYLKARSPDDSCRQDWAFGRGKTLKDSGICSITTSLEFRNGILSFGLVACVYRY